MKDMGKDSKVLQKEIFGRCTVRAKELALGIGSDSENESKPIGWRESEMKDGITQR